MARGTRKRRRAALTKARRSRGSLIWYVISGVIVVVGIALIAISQSDAKSPMIGEHWHAALGVNVCGEWVADAPEFHNDADSPSIRAGIHSHGDGLIHIHPVVSAESGDRATVGKYFGYGGWVASEDSFTMWDGQEHNSGDDCNGNEAQVRWTVNGEEQSGDILSYHPQDGDIIALALLGEGEDIGVPPAAAGLAAPQDMQTAPDGSPVETAPPESIVVTPETDASGAPVTPDTTVTPESDAPPAADGAPETPASSTP